MQSGSRTGGTRSSHEWVGARFPAKPEESIVRRALEAEPRAGAHSAAIYEVRPSSAS
jgi:hypothetical protein